MRIENYVTPPSRMARIGVSNDYFTVEITIKIDKPILWNDVIKIEEIATSLKALAMTLY